MKDSDSAQTLPGPLQTAQYLTVEVTDVTPGDTFAHALEVAAVQNTPDNALPRAAVLTIAIARPRSRACV